MVVVDPGVGTDRRPMAARIGDSFYVGPDNGIITLWRERAVADGQSCEFVALDKPRYRLPVVSHVFHGRDIFAPAAGHLAAGVPLHELGSPFSDPVRLHLPAPKQREGGWSGEVIHLDHFGNIATNIREEHLANALEHKKDLVVRLTDTRISGLVDTFGERDPGTLIALMGSTGNLIVSVVNGDAAGRLGVKVGDAVDVDVPVSDFPGKLGATA